MREYEQSDGCEEQYHLVGTGNLGILRGHLYLLSLDSSSIDHVPAPLWPTKRLRDQQPTNSSHLSCQTQETAYLLRDGEFTPVRSFLHGLPRHFRTSESDPFTNPSP